MTNIASSLLKAVNDLTGVRSYGDGWLVTTPLTYSDGDSVVVLVEPVNSGFRVTDRAEAFDRLIGWGVDPESGKAAQGVKAARSGARLAPLGGSDPTETATFGDASDLGIAILAVAQSAARVEQLRWLARDLPTLSFDDRLTNRIVTASRSHGWKYVRRAPLPLAHGRTKRVTASVSGERGTAFVQAVSDADYERSTINCFYLFERSLEARTSLVAALAGEAERWPQSLRDDLSEVGTVVFFAEPHALEAELERITGAVPVS